MNQSIHFQIFLFLMINLNSSTYKNKRLQESLVCFKRIKESLDQKLLRAVAWESERPMIWKETSVQNDHRSRAAKSCEPVTLRSFFGTEVNSLLFSQSVDGSIPYNSQHYLNYCNSHQPPNTAVYYKHCYILKFHSENNNAFKHFEHILQVKKLSLKKRNYLWSKSYSQTFSYSGFISKTSITSSHTMQAWRQTDLHSYPCLSIYYI